jgi:hypothetical protein
MNSPPGQRGLIFLLCCTEGTEVESITCTRYIEHSANPSIYCNSSVISVDMRTTWCFSCESRQTCCDITLRWPLGLVYMARFAHLTNCGIAILRNLWRWKVGKHREEEAPYACTGMSTPLYLPLCHSPLIRRHLAMRPDVRRRQ